MKYAIVTLIAGMVIGFLFHAGVCSRQVETIEVPVEVAVRDTVYVKQVVARIDTVYVYEARIVADRDELLAEGVPGESVYANTIAVGDTTVKEGRFDAIYYFPPLNAFDFTWTPKPYTQVVTVPIEYHRKWYEHPAFLVTAGALVTGTIVYLVK